MLVEREMACSRAAIVRVPPVGVIGSRSDNSRPGVQLRCTRRPGDYLGRPPGPRPRRSRPRPRACSRPETPVVVEMGVIISAKDARKYSHPVSVGNGFGKRSAKMAGRSTTIASEASPVPAPQVPRFGSPRRPWTGRGCRSGRRAKRARRRVRGNAEVGAAHGRRDRQLAGEACVVEPFLKDPATMLLSSPTASLTDSRSMAAISTSSSPSMIPVHRRAFAR